MSSVGTKIGGCGPFSFLPKRKSQLFDSNHNGINNIHRSWSRRMAKLTIDTNCELYRYVSDFSSFDMRNTDVNSSIRFICGDPAVQSNIVGAVNISTGWTFNTATAVVMGNVFADNVYVKTGGALRST